MNRAILMMVVVLATACAESGNDQQDEGRASEGYEAALDKARKARSDAEAAMEEKEREIENNQPPD